MAAVLTPPSHEHDIAATTCEAIDDAPSERGFAIMRAAFATSGGIARAGDLARLLDDEHRRGEFVDLARLIRSGEVFDFEWRDTFWVPMFQFELRDLSLKPRPRQVLTELATQYDGWMLAAWFVRPNAWLHERRPIELLDSELPAVLDAARADRFVAAG
ncbi:MAG: hypothetical protein ABIP61_07750 [Burkholderiaceae bacterium]